MSNSSTFRRLMFGALGSAVIAVSMAATIPSLARAEQAPLSDKPFAEHRIVLQLSDNDTKKQEVVTFGPGIDLLRPENANRKLVESLVAQGVRFDVCLNTVDTIERETGHRPDIIPAATPVQVGVGQILSLTENGYTLVRP